MGLGAGNARNDMSDVNIQLSYLIPTYWPLFSPLPVKSAPRPVEVGKGGESENWPFPPSSKTRVLTQREQRDMAFLRYIYILKDLPSPLTKPRFKWLLFWESWVEWNHQHVS